MQPDPSSGLTARLVPRTGLIDRLDAGLHRKLTFVSAPAGCGKTMLVSEWVDHLRLDAARKNQIANRIAWLSLDEGDNDPTRFLSCFAAALQTIDARQEPVGAMGEGALSAPQSPQPPPTAAILTGLINETGAAPDRIVLVLDGYHVIDARPIRDALTFLR